MLIFLGLGLLVGALSGFLGIGGGIILIPALMWLIEGMDQRRAAGMTLAVLSLPVVLPSAWRYLTDGHMLTDDLWHVGLIAIGFLVGGFIGSSLVKEVDIQTLKILFGLMLFYVAVRSLVSADSDAAAAFYGILAAALAWITFLFLRAIGRRQAQRPTLAASIESHRPKPADPIDYSI